MQIAGSECKVCGLKILLSSEGEYCPNCRTFAHTTCEPEKECRVCGKPLLQYEHSEANPLREAIVPRSLRPTSIGAPMLAAGSMLLFGVLIFVFYSCVANGH